MKSGHAWRRAINAEARNRMARKPDRLGAALEAAGVKPKAPRRHLEDAECMAFIAWCQVTRWKNGTIADRIFHIPNGGRRNPREAARFKRMGVRPGVLDYFLPIPVNHPDFGYSGGLWIEMKSRDGRVDPEQHRELKQLRDDGYSTVVCYSWIQAATAVAAYLCLPANVLEGLTQRQELEDAQARSAVPRRRAVRRQAPL